MTRRSYEDWQNATAQEHKKLTKKTAKDLAGALSKTTLERLPQEQKNLLPTEVIDVLEAGLSTESADQDKEKILENLLKIKKDTLVNAVALLNIEEEKQKESDCWDTWQRSIESIMINADDPDADHHPTAPLDEKDAIFSPIYSTFQKESKHWQAQRLASFATWALLGSYSGCDLAKEVGGTGEVQVSGIDQFQDVFHDLVGVYKKKLVLSMNMPEPGNISEETMKSLRLCFPGRLVPAPQGQPPTFLKTKIKLQNLGLYGFIFFGISVFSIRERCFNTHLLLALIS